MSKLLKKCLILASIIVMSLCICVYATEEPVAEDIAETTSLETEETVVTEQEPETPLSSSTVTRVSNINSYDQANLQLNNILSIILISIGVLLILFAIALLIRLKKQ